MTAAKLAARDTRFYYYPQFPNSYLKVGDLDTTLGLNFTRRPGTDVDECRYLFTNQSSSAGAKSAFVGMKIALPSNFVSLTAVQVFYQCTGASTAKIIVRVYDSTANLRHESSPLAVGSRGR